MSRDGNGHEPAPRIEMTSTGASDSETAAVVAAVERFLADTAPAATPDSPRISPWARAALEEGIAARQISGYVWGQAPSEPRRI